MQKYILFLQRHKTHNSGTTMSLEPILGMTVKKSNLLQISPKIAPISPDHVRSHTPPRPHTRSDPFPVFKVYPTLYPMRFNHHPEPNAYTGVATVVR